MRKIKLTRMQQLQVRRVVDSEFSLGDPYDDGTIAGKVKAIEPDRLIIETQNEDGDVVDAEVAIADFLDTIKDDENIEYEDDEIDAAQAARDLVTEDTVYAIELDGYVTVSCPSEIEDVDEFAKECAFVAQNLADTILASEDQDYAKIEHAVEDGEVILYVAQ